MRTWVDASTLIALDNAGEVRVLRDLLGRIAITREVEEEVFTGRESRALREARGNWIDVADVKGNYRRWLSLGLGRGEGSLLVTPARDRLVLDEVPARTAAEAEGREYVGVLGLLLEGVRNHLLSGTRARDIVARLTRAGFHLSGELYDTFLRELERSD